MNTMPEPKGLVVIAGGSGFLGLNLARALIRKHYAVRILSRRPPVEAGPWEFVRWNPHVLGDWKRALEGASALVNLAGRSVDCVKNPENIDEILRSRVEATRRLGEALRNVKCPPAVWVQMSTAHIYGDSLETVCSEDSVPGYGLAPDVGHAWEQAYQDAVLPGMRQVILRTSFVLGRHGGALPRLIGLARFGLGGRVGHGKQGISWLHEEDMNRLFLRALEIQTMQGSYLATAPSPVSQEDFMRQLRRAMRIPIGLPTLPWMVRIGAPLFLRTDPELALYGRYCVSRRLPEEGFTFQYPNLAGALQSLFEEGQKNLIPSARPPAELPVGSGNSG